MIAKAMKTAFDDFMGVDGAHESNSGKLRVFEAGYRAAIEAAERQEPVGIVTREADKFSGHRPLVNWFFTGVKNGTKLYTTPQPAPHVQEKYNELLFAVANKYPNESRHETALRYIKEREARIDSVACQDAPKVPK